MDRYLFGRVPDYTIELTDLGRQQAEEAGKRLKTLVADESVYFYISPFWRARSTFEGVAAAFPRRQFVYSEEPRLREQEWGYLRSTEEFDRICRERTEYGTFYYVIFDNRDMSILDTWASKGKSGGIGLCNYWARSFYRTIAEINPSKFYQAKKKVKDGLNKGVETIRSGFEKKDKE